MSTDLAGRTALVTGGTRGIGRGIVEVLVASGASVVFSGRDAVAGELLQSSLPVGEGQTLSFVPADVSDVDSVAHLVSAARVALGGIDILCHCAGIYPEAELGSMTDAMWHDVIDTNLTSTMLLTREALPHLSVADNGRVILISSISGPRTGISALTHYCASKAGMEGFARAAAVELAASGITVNCVAPGTILTEGLAALYSAEGALESVEARIPAGRLGTPADIGHTVAFLASSDSSFITGQSITVDGGQTLPEVQG